MELRSGFCACGSGKRYRHCHGRNSYATVRDSLVNPPGCANDSLAWPSLSSFQTITAYLYKHLIKPHLKRTLLRNFKSPAHLERAAVATYSVWRALQASHIGNQAADVDLALHQGLVSIIRRKVRDFENFLNRYDTYLNGCPEAEQNIKKLSHVLEFRFPEYAWTPTMVSVSLQRSVTDCYSKSVESGVAPAGIDIDGIYNETFQKAKQFLNDVHSQSWKGVYFKYVAARGDALVATSRLLPSGLPKEVLDAEWRRAGTLPDLQKYWECSKCGATLRKDKVGPFTHDVVNAITRIGYCDYCGSCHDHMDVLWGKFNLDKTDEMLEA